MRTRIAAIDIGTVTARLLVADVTEEGLTELSKRAEIVNLGEGVDATGVLSEAAMERTCATVASYLQIVHGLDEPDAPVTVVAMATSASRDAKNAQVFQDKLAELGVTLTVIPGEREAALSFLGASADFPGERLLVTDVGGGSTELICGIGGQEPLFKHSFNIGCRRVTERNLAGDPPTAEEIAAAQAWCHPQFASFFDRIRAEGFEIDRMVSVAGTATTVVSIRDRMEVYDSSRVHGAVVTAADLDRVTSKVASVPLAERVKITGLQAGRAPVIVAGMLILQDLVQLAGTGSFTASESDILQGIIMTTARA
ncbi:MAG: Ppx/GppA family phosphatase [Eggerthellaceae bacterium]|jgi:exopolyphosphatase/guanosine-5'-triphosphate,3'-diphosphate pyrophosphatase|nr:Ppx/GppA family phosphatase [Eggerthellaceae bacterium]